MSRAASVSRIDAVGLAAAVDRSVGPGGTVGTRAGRVQVTAVKTPVTTR